MWFSGVSQSRGQWKSSSLHGIPRPLTIFATAGQGDISCFVDAGLVKVIPLCSGALEMMSSGLLSSTGLGSEN